VSEREKLNSLSGKIIDAAIKVHKALGPGLVESCYEACLAFELMQQGLKVERQKPLPVIYREIKLDCGYRLDLFIDNLIIVEIKSVEKIVPIHKAQLLSYLKLTHCKLGLLINFNVELLKDGLVRVVNDFPDS